MMLNETENTMLNTTFLPVYVTSDPNSVIEQRIQECNDLLSKSTSTFSTGNELNIAKLFQSLCQKMSMQWFVNLLQWNFGNFVHK